MNNEIIKDIQPRKDFYAKELNQEIERLQEQQN